MLKWVVLMTFVGLARLTMAQSEPVTATKPPIKQEGSRVTAAERQCERYLKPPITTPRFTPDQRLEIFSRAVEPMLQRELKHKGTANGDGSYSAELIGYVEIVGQGA